MIERRHLSFFAAVLAAACVLPGCLPEADDEVEDAGGQADGALTADGAADEDGGAPDAAAPECPGGEARDACGVCGGDGPSTWYPDVDGDGRGDGRAPVEACAQPPGYVENGADQEPDCATNDTDECGVCGGPGRRAFHADLDGDGLGDPDLSVRACAAPEGFVANADDTEPGCATNDTDVCGVCAGPGLLLFYLDLDGDGLGDPEMPVRRCAPEEGLVDNGDDPEPLCETNDTDECDVCGGPGPLVLYADEDGDGLGDPATAVESCEGRPGHVENGDDPEPDCATNDTDRCGVCGGGDRALDCNGVCDGEAFRDRCGECVGGDTGREPSVADEDGDGIPDACDDCPVALEPRLVIQWTEVPPYAGNAGGPYTFQLVMRPSGAFTFQYRQVEPFGASNTVGYQTGPRDGVTLAMNNGFVTDHPVVHFEPWQGRLEVDLARPMEWIDIRDTGVALRLGDDAEAEIPIGFAFPFADALHEHVNVSSNGAVHFGGEAIPYQNQNLPDGRLGAVIAPFWDDLNPAAGGTVYYEVLTPACAEDCNGDLGGFAFVDACDECVGGNTGRRPDANVDCAGECHGEAFIDACGQCAGGNSGREPNEEGDCRPDLIVNEAYLRATVHLDYIDVRDQCLIEERCVRGDGRRKLIRFGTQIANIGRADLVLGEPREGVDHWVWDQCHRHFHFEAYAAYDLYDPQQNAMLPIGSKNGFAVIDIGVYDPELAPLGCRGYNGRNQGITAGCQDTYSANLNCQWVDVTGIPDGVYEVVITTNPDGVIPEERLDNNSARVRVQIQGDELQVVDP